MELEFKKDFDETKRKTGHGFMKKITHLEKVCGLELRLLNMP